MQIGVSLASAHAVSDPREGAQHMIERAAVAWAAGMDALFVGDHHATRVPYYQNGPILGRLLAEWGDRPVGALYLLPLWSPLLVAEQVATLASIARGRFILQCAVGPADAQFEAMGVDPRQRPSRFEQSLSILRRLWEGEAVDPTPRYPGRIEGMKPLPPEPIEVWIGAVAPAAVDRAARLGDGWLAAPALTVDQAKRQLALYAERCQQHHRELGVAAIRRDVYVGETAEEAEATAGPVIRAGHRGFPPDACVYGSVDQVTEKLGVLAEIGFDHVSVRSLVPDQQSALGSIERLAEVRRQLR